MIAVALIARADFIIYVAYVMIAVYAWSRWLVPRFLRHLQSSRTFHSRSFLGEPLDIQLQLYNPGQLPILWLQLVESVPPELRRGPPVNHVIHLGRRKKRTLTYQVQAMKRGYYRLGPLQITAGDLFGFHESHTILEPGYLTVYPRIVPLTKLTLPSRLPFGTLASKQRLFEDPARPQGVRDYHLGDSLRLVNWKVSAHSGALLVRTHEPAISLETAILLNLNSNEYSSRYRQDGPEWAIVLAASLASHLTNRRQAVGLISNGVDPLLLHEDGPANESSFDAASGRLALAELPQAHAGTRSTPGPGPALLPGSIPPKAGRAHLMQILELLARIEAAPTVDFAEYAGRTTRRLNWGVTLMAIVPYAGEDTCATLHRLVRAGFNVVLLVIEQDADFSAVRQRASVLGFSAYHVPDNQALRNWQEASVS